MEMTYTVQVKVPLGIRHGKMRLQINNGIIAGDLELLGSVEKVEGVLSKNGTIRLNGNLASPIRCIPFKGTGTMKDGAIHMKLVHGEADYQLTGNLSDGKGENKV